MFLNLLSRLCVSGDRGDIVPDPGERSLIINEAQRFMNTEASEASSMHAIGAVETTGSAVSQRRGGMLHKRRKAKGPRQPTGART